MSRKLVRDGAGVGRSTSLWAAAGWPLLMVLVLGAGLAYGQGKPGKKNDSKPGVAKNAPGKNGPALGKPGMGPGKPAGKKAEPVPDIPQRKVTIAKVDPDTHAKVLASAAEIDKLVDADLKQRGIEPNPPLTDEQFLRRAYIDIVGTIPTHKQAKIWLALSDKSRRSRLIDNLLNQEGYALSFYNYWADVLRLREERMMKAVPSQPYNEWVKIALESNRPYDAWVREMITATGRAFDNPATGYLLRDAGMPLDATNNTVRVFLGTQIGCAQCHDHPFDKWTQMEFYEVAAYLYPTVYRADPKDVFGVKNGEKKLRDEVAKIDKEFRPVRYRPVIEANLVAIADSQKKLTLPSDYKYDDAKPKAVVAPKAIFEPEVKMEKGESTRSAFARWMTSPQNPRFAKNIANRMWKRLFGAGLIEPADDIRDDTVAVNPPLMEFLTKEMVRVKFDLKEFQRILLNTQAYQRQASVAEVTPGEDYHFPGPILRRMTAEQVWDSFLTLAQFHELDDYHREPARLITEIVSMDLAKVSPQKIVDSLKEFNAFTGNKAARERTKPFEYQGQILVRASELPSPLPPGHFLRQFGQSDREQIEASSLDGSVPQVLQMFNGPITHMMLDPQSIMYRNVTAEKDPEKRVDVIFVSVLCRKPVTEEKKAALDEIKKHGNAGYGNVIWSLVNTPEFLFVQ
jgi:hypothetical protein